MNTNFWNELTNFYVNNQLRSHEVKSRSRAAAVRFVGLAQASLSAFLDLVVFLVCSSYMDIRRYLMTV